MHYRALTALFSLSGFILMTVTGIILYIEPAGRIAYWTDWQLFGLDKSQWGNIHIISSFLWVVAGAFHLYFNWNVLMAYIYRKAKAGRRLKRELVTAVVVTVIVCVGSVIPIQPFKAFLDLGESIKESWITQPEYEPPFGHAEMLSLKTFCKKLNIDLAQAMTMLQQKGINVDSPEQAVESIAIKNNTSPMAMYIAIRELEKKVEAPAGKAMTPEMVEERFSGKGIGKKKFSTLVQELKLDPAVIRERLKKKGLEIGDDENLREAGDRYGLNPLDLLKAILVDDYEIPKS